MTAATPEGQGLGKSGAKRIVAALCLCLAGAAVSALLLMQHHGEGRAVSAVNRVCGDARTSGCDEVARSSWSSVAGIPVAAAGVFFYLSLGVLLVLALLAGDETRLAAAGIVLAGLALGLLADLFLLGVQVLSIKAYCVLCLFTYLLTGAALVTLLPARRGGLGGALGRAEGRLVLAGWALATLGVAGTVIAGDATLRYREARRQATLLGAPAPVPVASPVPAPTPTPGAEPTPASTAAPAAGPADAAYWRDRYQKLQATIDDPRKLEAYFSEKAQREYDSASPVTIDLDGVPGRGPANAPVQVVEFSDFLCPYCRSLAPALAQFVQQAGGRVIVYFKNYPLDATCNEKLKQSIHPGACNVALGAVCAQKQGRFEAYHDKVFSTELHNPQPADVLRAAGDAGLNVVLMQTCLADPQTRRTLDAQIAEANRLGVAATPTLYINGRKLPRINDFVAVVDKEAQKKGFAPLGAR
jgi:protein-disulfide isomerase/uncharacterized membrane protein